MLSPEGLPVMAGAAMEKLVLTAAFALACHCAPSHADNERSCEIVAASAQLSGKTNCRDGDVATISGMSAKEVPETIARYCDFWAQIVVFPDAGTTDASSHFVLCKYRQREAAPSQP
ncbi:Putative uncharacterized protein [Mesorhizobium loti]|nr:Putative uncharacterized protein [Mesorhizobium loti]